MSFRYLLALTSISLVASSFTAFAQASEILTLDEARRLVVENNPTLKGARETLLQAEYTIDKAWTMIKPQWNAVGTYTHNNTGASLQMPNFESISLDPTLCQGNPFCFTEYNSITVQKQDTFGFMSTFSQPLFLPRALPTIKNAYNGFELAKINEQNMQDFMVHKVEVAYYSALTTRKFVEIAKQAVEISNEHLKVSQAKFKVGDQPKISVLRAEIDVNRAEQDVKRAESSYELAKEFIGLLIDRPPDFELEIPRPLNIPKTNLQQMIDRALEERRDLISAKLELDIGKKMKKDAWFRFLPSLVATGAIRVSDTKGFFDSYFNWNVGLAVSIPLYDGGLRYVYLDEARSKIRQAELKIEEKGKSIQSEIRQLWLKIEMADANLKKARQALELAREQSQLAKASFEAGAASNLDVLDANSMLLISEYGVAQEELNLQTAIIKLDRARKMFVPAGGSSMPQQVGSANSQMQSPNRM